MLENKAARDQKLQADLERDRKLVTAVKKHGGPCVTVTDVDEMLRQRLTAVKQEIQYRKFVGGESSKLLKVTGKLDVLIRNLKGFLAGCTADEPQTQETCTTPSASSTSSAKQQTKRRKRVKEADDQVVFWVQP